MLTSHDFTGLVTPEFIDSFWPIPATNTLALGALTPDFELPDVTHQRSVRLSDYRGDRPVILAFTRIFTAKQYCPLCFPHIKALSNAYQDFVQRGAEVLMITSTDEAQSQIVREDLGLEMPLLSDPRRQIFRAYQTGQALGAPLPAQFVLDRTGRLQFSHLFSFLAPNATVEALLQQLDRGQTLAS